MADISAARITALAASMLTLAGWKVSHDSIGGTMTPKAAIDIMETEIALGEATPYETDMQPFIRTFGTACVAGAQGPYKELLDTAVTGMMARAVTLG